MSEDIMQEYDLPELPEPADELADGATARPVLFRFQQENITLGDGTVYALADAQEYCEQADTSGSPDWFVGWRHA
jgi:hypothetical protein